MSRLGRRLQEILAGPRSSDTPFGRLRVIRPEGRITFKLQGDVNDPRLTQDLEDTRALLRANRDRVDLAEVRGHLRLFGREVLLDEIPETQP